MYIYLSLPSYFTHMHMTHTIGCNSQRYGSAVLQARLLGFPLLGRYPPPQITYNMNMCYSNIRTES